MKSFPQVFAAAAAFAGLLFFSGAAFAPMLPPPKPEVRPVLMEAKPLIQANEEKTVQNSKPWAIKLEERFRTERVFRSAV